MCSIVIIEEKVIEEAIIQMEDNHQKNSEENPIQRVLSSSKDVKCPICLATNRNRALTDPCSHEFCLDCISEWSANHNRCPICRQTYYYVRYNFVSDEKFDQSSLEERRLSFSQSNLFFSSNHCSAEPNV